LPGSLHQYSSAAINLLTGKTLQEQADFFGAYTSDFYPEEQLGIIVNDVQSQSKVGQIENSIKKIIKS
jgi:hypothetical protein